MPLFTCQSTPIKGLIVIGRKPRSDKRGFFCRLFCQEELAAFGFSGPAVQINHTLTRQRGAVRGMHFQRAPHEETKLVSCIAGEVFDVAVDLRPDSPSYLRWHAEILSAQNVRAMLIPKGFAHGFQTLTEDCQLIYFHDEAYAPAFEAGVNPLDSRLNVAWPLPISQISDRDRAFPLSGA